MPAVLHAVHGQVAVIVSMCAPAALLVTTRDAYLKPLGIDYMANLAHSSTAHSTVPQLLLCRALVMDGCKAPQLLCAAL